MHPQAIGPVPEETVRVARAAYPKGNLSLRLRDHLGTIYEDGQFATLWQPAHEPWRLALNAHRAGIEGTISQAIRTCEVRRSRYRGLPKTHLHHMLMATALNVWRIGMWLAEEPLAQTRHARFVRLYHSAA